jgi:para-aminobenzoate synthetase/4-amino-4-deoxychorismate lyase
MLFFSPVRHIVANSPGDLDAALEAIEQARVAGLFPCGYLTYEAGYFLVDKQSFTLSKAAGRELSLLSFFCFSRRERLDREGVDRFLDGTGDRRVCAIHDLRFADDFDGYRASLGRIGGYIQAGDTYQVNYTLKAHFSYAGHPVSLYRALRAHQSVEFGAYVSFPEARILSLSPELFVRKEGTAITSRPMKGTARRGSTPGEDTAITAALREDPKTRSENLMIVDLIRNDIGRIALPGSVVVRDLFDVQTFETVHQMVSTVEGRVPADLPVSAALRRLFPCGSITGAPKIRTMELIEGIEAEPRGVYTGAIGYVAPDNDYCFNVAIRTIVSTTEGRGELGVGSGIIAESDPRAEFDECLLKARFLVAVNGAFQLVETMRFVGGCPAPDGPEHFDLHLARMRASARTFEFSFDEGRVTEAVGAAIVANSEGAFKVRVLLSQDGRVDVGVTLIPPADETASRPVAWSRERVDSGSIFQYHKTTARSLYEREFEVARGAGAYDVLFLNERGEVAEASRHNVFVEKNGCLLTPPLACGVLPGVKRGVVLGNQLQSAREAVLYPGDVLSADRVFLSNSVRGMVEVHVRPAAGRGRSEVR